MHMRRLLTAAATVAAVAALPVSALAGSSTDRATGGGQIIFDSEGGAGNTVTFTARGTEEAATGRVTFIDRSAGTGEAMEKFHGIVTCLRVEGNGAEISGTERDTGEAFNLRVIDNGQGAAAEDDVVQFDRVDEPGCGDDDSDDEDPQFALGRGNAQVYDASQSSSSSSASAKKSSSKSTTTQSSSLTSSLLR